MSETNQHGLTRDIPENVKRDVRQRDGFGCVVCGNAIVEYEHFRPEFKDATQHNADGIILLCDKCHRKKGKFLSVETIATAAANPKCRRQGYSSEVFDIGVNHPEIIMGTLTFTNVDVLLKIGDEPILSVSAPEQPGSPFRLNAHLRDINGDTVLQIADNEWQTPTSNWDVEVVGPRIIIRSAARNIALIVRSEPPNKIVIERMKLLHRYFYIEGREGKATIIMGGGNVFRTESSTIFDARCGICVDGNKLMIGAGGGVILGGTTHIGAGTGPTFLGS